MTEDKPRKFPRRHGRPGFGLLHRLLPIERRLTDVSGEATIQVPAFALPASDLLDKDTHNTLRRLSDDRDEFQNTCPPGSNADALYRTRLYKRMRGEFNVHMSPQEIGGVYTEVFTPEEGIAEANANRVLLNLHGGGFQWYSRVNSHLESIPLASVGRIKVISVDYRQAPDYAFPAASEDVAAVYGELLKSYSSQNIGIYGCSAGALLTAEVVAWLQHKGLPRPAAIGMFCNGAAYWTEGDMGRFGVVRDRPMRQFLSIKDNPYFKDVDQENPLAFPVRSNDVLARFPPSLLVSATRDIALSSVIHTHTLLIQQGVEADLHVWEGLDHAFFYDSGLQASRAVYEIAAKFFRKHLGPLGTHDSKFAPSPNLENQLAIEVAKFVAMDKTGVLACEVLFVGSSSIARWASLSHDLAPLSVLNRGFGGSHIEHVNRWFAQIIGPHRPRAIVFYGGENDLASGKPVDTVVSGVDQFMAHKRAALGETPVYFISLKPSKLLRDQFALQTQVNNIIHKRSETVRDLRYIDVATPMLEEGRPGGLFTSDDVHLSPAGYVIWARALRDALMPNLREA